MTDHDKIADDALRRIDAALTADLERRTAKGGDEMSESTLLAGIRWPSNELRRQVVPIVTDLCDRIAAMEAERDAMRRDADALADAVERDINHEGWQGVCDEEVAVEQALAAYRASRKGVSGE